MCSSDLETCGYYSDGDYSWHGCYTDSDIPDGAVLDQLTLRRRPFTLRFIVYDLVFYTDSTYTKKIRFSTTSRRSISTSYLECDSNVLIEEWQDSNHAYHFKNIDEMTIGLVRVPEGSFHYTKQLEQYVPFDFSKYTERK